MFRQLATQVSAKIMHACAQLRAGVPAHSHCHCVQACLHIAIAIFKTSGRKKVKVGVSVMPQEPRLGGV